MEMTEAAFQRHVTHLADLYGWRWYHTHDSRRSPAGFPDLVLVRERVIFAELKTLKGRVSDAQASWIATLQATGAEVYVFRPSDLDRMVVILNRRER